MMMASLEFVCWNTCGVRASTDTTTDKLAFFDKEIDRNFAVACILESHHHDESDFPKELLEYQATHQILHTPAAIGEYAGIIALVSDTFEVTETNVTIPGRLLNFKIKCNTTQKEYNISAFYGFQWQRLKNVEKERYLNLFRTIHKNTDNNIIFGDFNFADTDLDKGKGMNPNDKSCAKIWEKFLSETTLVDPFRLSNPKRRIYSFEVTLGKSRIDRAYVNQDDAIKITNFKYIRTPFKLAHKIMKFTYQERKDYGNPLWKMNSSILDDALFENLVQEIVIDIHTLNIADPIARFELIDHVTNLEAKKYSEDKARVKRTLKNNVISQLERLEQIDQKNRNVQQNQDLATLQNRLRQIEMDEIEGHKIRTRGQPVYEMNEPNIDFYAKLEKRSAQRQVISELQDENEDRQTENEKLLRIAENYYTNLYSESITDEPKQDKLLAIVDKKVSEEQRRTLDAPLDDRELTTAVFQLNKNKSPG